MTQVMQTPEETARVRALANDLYPRLLRFFRSKVPHPDCHDLAQQTFVEYLKQLRAKSIDNHPRYVWGIARFQLLKFIERRRPGVQFNSQQMSMAAVGTSMSLVFARRNHITEALRELNVDEQMAFELRYGEELQLEEVADAMGVSLATVKRYLKAALEKLRAKLRAVLGDSEEAVGAQVAAAYREN